MMLSLTSSSISMACWNALWSPMATVIGLWIIIMATGDMEILSPAMATTDAAEAAIPSMRTSTFPGYSFSML